MRMAVNQMYIMIYICEGICVVFPKTYILFGVESPRIALLRLNAKKGIYLSTFL